MLDLSSADLRGYDLAGMIFTQSDFRNAQLDSSDLTGAKFSGCILEGAHFMRARGRDVIFEDCRAINVRFDEVRFTGASFVDVEARGSIFQDATLWKSTWKECDLREAVFAASNLDEAYFDRVILGDTIFARVSLDTVIGLETCRHVGASTIGIDTLYRSRSDLAHFLRAAGVPSDFASYTSAFTSQAIEYESCFLSYSARDDDFVTRFFNDLQRGGIRAWYAPHDMRIGDHIRQTIDESLSLRDRVILVLSRASIESQWVEQEVESALSRERAEGRTILFPVAIDNTIFEAKAGWPSYVRHTRHVGNFVHWNDEAQYNRALEQVLKDLRKRKRDAHSPA